MNLGTSWSEKLLSVGILLLIGYGYIAATVRTIKAWSSGRIVPPVTGFLSELTGPIDVAMTIGLPVVIAFAFIVSYRSGATIAWNHGHPALTSVEEAACNDAGGTFEFESGEVIEGESGRFATRTLYCTMPDKSTTRYTVQGRDIVSVTRNVDPSKDDPEAPR